MASLSHKPLESMWYLVFTFVHFLSFLTSLAFRVMAGASSHYPTERLYCTVHALYSTVHCTLQYCTAQYSVLYCTVQYSTLYSTILYITVHCTLLYSTVQCTVHSLVYSTVLYIIVHCNLMYCTAH